MGFCSTSLCHSPRRDVSIHLFICSYSLIYRFVPEINLPSADTTEGSQSAYSPSSPPVRRRSCTSLGLPGEWPVRSDRPFCRSLGNGQAATLLQSNILLKTRRYRDKISTCYCRAVPVPFQRLYKVFCGIGGLQNRTHANHCSIISVGGAHACGQRCATSEP